MHKERWCLGLSYAGDSAVSPHYTANPIGKLFDAGVKAVLIEPFLRLASITIS